MMGRQDRDQRQLFYESTSWRKIRRPLAACRISASAENCRVERSDA